MVNAKYSYKSVVRIISNRKLTRVCYRLIDLWVSTLSFVFLGGWRKKLEAWWMGFSADPLVIVTMASHSVLCYYDTVSQCIARDRWCKILYLSCHSLTTIILDTINLVSHCHSPLVCSGWYHTLLSITERMVVSMLKSGIFTWDDGKGNI